MNSTMSPLQVIIMMMTTEMLMLTMITITMDTNNKFV